MCACYSCTTTGFKTPESKYCPDSVRGPEHFIGITLKKDSGERIGPGNNYLQPYIPTHICTVLVTVYFTPIDKSVIFFVITHFFSSIKAITIGYMDSCAIWEQLHLQLAKLHS